MGFRVAVGTALAVLLLCGVGLAAPAASGAFGEMPARGAGAGSDHDAAGSAEELRVGAAELAAVPAESRVLFAKVLGRLEGLRGELKAVRAGKVRLEERAEGLSVRVAMLEESEASAARARRSRRRW